jgi:hypothetical protein
MDYDNSAHQEYDQVAMVDDLVQNDFRGMGFIRFGIQGTSYTREIGQVDVLQLEKQNEFHLPQEIEKLQKKNEEHKNKIEDLQVKIKEEDWEGVQKFILEEIVEKGQEIKKGQDKLYKIERKETKNEDDLMKKVEEEEEVEDRRAWDEEEDVVVTEKKLAVLVIGENKDQEKHLAEFLGGVQNRMALDCASLIDWNRDQGHEVGFRVSEAIEEIKGIFLDFFICKKLNILYFVFDIYDSKYSIEHNLGIF